VVICTLGDLLLDVIVRLERPLARGDDAPATTQASAGGQAANVAAWAATLGAEARLIAKRADDEAGRLVASDLAGRGVAVHGPVVEGRNGVVVSLVEPDGERSLASDRGVAPELRPEELEPAWLEGCDVLHLSGYSLLREPIGEAAARAAGLVHAAGGQVSVDLSTWSAIRDHGPAQFRARLERVESDILFASERELETLGDTPAATLVLKRGADGLVLVRGGHREELASLPAKAIDSTGAGDALAAGFLVGGAQLGLEAAARCVAKLGAMP
jgi:sugar/nucleoside kinase (ribokinase family)